ncbi:hypothetical protein VZT92_015817 [Zoarces viviparus]|uniref:Uncharacterized protein n=1 Tax=Zoarces viviparus TaxID=48416 RepID=A0AAW1EZ01_ZOAVI
MPSVDILLTGYTVRSEEEKEEEEEEEDKHGVYAATDRSNKTETNVHLADYHERRSSSVVVKVLLVSALQSKKRFADIYSCSAMTWS